MLFLNLNQQKIPLLNIVYLESDANYTYVHTSTSKKALSSYTIGVLYKQLDKYIFFRANRKLVFNLHFINEVWYDGDYVFVNLATGKHVVLSRRQSSVFKLFLKKNFGLKITHRKTIENLQPQDLQGKTEIFKADCWSSRQQGSRVARL